MEHTPLAVVQKNGVNRGTSFRRMNAVRTIFHISCCQSSQHCSRIVCGVDPNNFPRSATVAHALMREEKARSHNGSLSSSLLEALLLSAEALDFQRQFSCCAIWSVYLFVGLMMLRGFISFCIPHTVLSSEVQMRNQLNRWLMRITPITKKLEKCGIKSQFGKWCWIAGILGARSHSLSLSGKKFDAIVYNWYVHAFEGIFLMD